VNISRSDLLDAVKQTKGFVSFSMSDPLKTQNFARYVWIGYDSDENCRNAIEYLKNCSIQDFNFNPSKSITSRKPIRTTPSLATDCFERDLELCQRLIREVFDKEKQIEPVILDELQRVCAS